MAKDAKEKEGGEKKKKPMNKIFLIALIVLIVLIIGGGAGAWFMGVFDSPESKEEEAAEKAREKDEIMGPLVQMEDFVVNIMHKDTTRFLKMGITLETKDVESSAKIQNRMPQVMDSVLLLVGNKRFDEIKDLQGKMQLKADLLARINTLIGNERVVNLYFTDFVVQ